MDTEGRPLSDDEASKTSQQEKGNIFYFFYSISYFF